MNGRRSWGLKDFRPFRTMDVLANRTAALLPCVEQNTSRRICSLFVLFAILAHGRMPRIKQWICASSLEVMLAQLRKLFSRRTASSGRVFLLKIFSHRWLSAILKWERKNVHLLHVYCNLGGTSSVSFCALSLPYPVVAISLFSLNADGLLLLCADAPATVRSFVSDDSRVKVRMWMNGYMFFQGDLKPSGTSR